LLNFRYPPFFDDNPFGIYEKILTGRISFPPHFHADARDIIKRFLTSDLSSRLGNLQGGAADVQNHKWFAGIAWQEVMERKVQSPIVPVCTGPGDTRNFEAYPEALAPDNPDISLEPLNHYFIGNIISLNLGF
jgi:serine/threonine protein kinase